MTFAEKVKFVRTQLKLNQTEFGALLSVNYTTVNRWEKERMTPSYTAIMAFEKLCKEHCIQFPEED